MGASWVDRPNSGEDVMKLVNANILNLETGKLERRDIDVTGSKIGGDGEGRVVDLNGAYLLPGFLTSTSTSP